MDAIITNKKNGETKVMLLSDETEYQEIDYAIRDSESHQFCYCSKSRPVNNAIVNTSSNFNRLTEMLQQLNHEGKLNEEQRKIFNNFKEQFDKLIKMF